MGMMLHGSLSPRYLAALRILADELGTTDCGAIQHLIANYAAPYLTDVDKLGFEALGFDRHGKKIKGVHTNGND